MHRELELCHNFNYSIYIKRSKKIMKQYLLNLSGRCMGNLLLILCYIFEISLKNENYKRRKKGTDSSKDN